MNKIKDELQDLPDDLKLKLTKKYMYVHEPEHFDKKINGKPKKQLKYSVSLIKHESTLDAYLHDKYSAPITAEQPKVERGYGLMSLFKSKN